MPLPENPVGALEEQLLTHFNEHVEGERELLAEYATLAESSPDAHVRYLIHLILDDERRHHRTFTELVNAIASSADMAPVEPAVPPLRRTRDEALLAVTERFLEREKEDARALRHLRVAMRPLRSTSLWSLLVQLMEQDTAKHIMILRFIRNSTRAS